MRNWPHCCLPALLLPRSSVRLDLLNSLGTETRNIYYFPLKSETERPQIPTTFRDTSAKKLN